MKLAICIPTYNRASSAITQINFLLNEIKENSPLLEFALYVRDNNSNQEEYLKLLDHNKENPTYSLKRNNYNAGLVGNLLKLHEEAQKKSEYIWFVGDDDKLLPGILTLVANEIRKKPNFTFINHRGVDSNSVVMESALPPDASLKRTSILDILEYSGTTMMFITACVYKTNLLNESIDKDIFKKTRLTAPLYWSLYCARENINLIHEKMIINKRGKTSWESEAGLVFGYWLPIELTRNIFLSKAKVKALSIFLKYLPACSKHLFKYILKIKLT